MRHMAGVPNILEDKISIKSILINCKMVHINEVKLDKDYKSSERCIREVNIMML